MGSTRWLAIVVVAGCSHNHNAPPDTLVRVDDEGPGVHCQYGGAAISTGRDSDRDGTLADGEVTSTQYVCNGATSVRCTGGSVLDGSVTVRDSADFAQLSGINCIDGDLIIAGISGEIPALPDLNTVTGEVVVAGNIEVTTLDSFSGLREIGQSFLIQGNDVLDDISAIADLDTVLSVFLIGNDALHDLVGLSPITQLRTKLTVANNPALTSLHGLENMVTAVSWLVVRSNRNLTDISALDTLLSAGAIEISGNSSLTSLTLPQLQKVDVRLLINLNAALTSVSLPQLATLSDGIVFSGDPVLASISMPSLLTTGVLTFENDTQLATIYAPSFGYATVDVNFYNLASLSSVDFGGLTAIGGTMRVYNTLPFSFAGFGSLESMGNLWLSNGGMTDFTGMHSLVTVAGEMTVAACPQLTSFAGLDAMTDIGGNLWITGNPSLSLSVAQAFANSMSIRGSITIN